MHANCLKFTALVLVLLTGVCLGQESDESAKPLSEDGAELRKSEDPADRRTRSGFRQATWMAAIRSISRETTDDDVKRILEQDDANKDGRIGEGDKIRPNLRRNFKTFDLNSDGFLDASELKKTGLRSFGGKVFLEAFDKDKDGYLAKDEALHPTLARDFVDLDTDEDGKLDLQEMNKIRGGMLFGRRRGGFGDQRGFAGLRNWDAVIQKAMTADADKNGRLSKTEADETVRALFDSLDTNKDDAVDENELRTNVRMLNFSRFAENLMQRWDKDGDGKVAKEDLPSFFSRGELDKDGDGFLTIDELRRLPLAAQPRRQRFEVADRDGDGKVSQEEAATPFIRDNFAKYDVDQNGVLSNEEYTELMNGDSDQRRAAGVKRFFGSFDANDDGELAQEEFPDRMRGRFATVDADGDGFVTQQEYSELLKNQASRRPVDRNEAARRIFRTNDSNGDGKVGKEEAATFFWERFARFDADDDGSVTEHEFTLGLGKQEHEANVRAAGQRLLGVQLKKADQGLAVGRVVPGSPAYNAQVHTGDVLLRIDGQNVESLDDVRQSVAKGSVVQKLDLIRDGENIELEIHFDSSLK